MIRHIGIVAASLGLALSVAPVFAQDQDRLEEAQRRLDLPDTQDGLDSFAIFDDDMNLIGVVDAWSGTSEQEVARVTESRFARRIGRRGRLLLSNSDDAVNVIGDMVCDNTFLPQEISFTAGVSAVAVLTVTLTYDTSVICGN